MSKMPTNYNWKHKVTSADTTLCSMIVWKLKVYLDELQMKQRVNNDDFGELGLTRSNLQKEGWLNNKQKFVLFNCLTV